MKICSFRQILLSFIPDLYKTHGQTGWKNAVLSARDAKYKIFGDFELLWIIQQYNCLTIPVKAFQVRQELSEREGLLTESSSEPRARQNRVLEQRKCAKAAEQTDATEQRPELALTVQSLTDSSSALHAEKKHTILLYCYLSLCAFYYCNVIYIDN